MDFGQLLHTAQQNEKLNKNGVRYYSTKFEPPKKEKKAKELSENIKKFLAKKEAEEKLKAEQEKRKKEELLALRSQDKKATRRVNVMLKRTKSANQSVIQDAVDNDNTAVTLVGPTQPDEDDYGYVSQEASAFYNKMMEKYSKMPDEPKFDVTKKKVSTNLSSTKDRVKAALEKEKEEAMLPHRRKRKHKEKDDGDDEGISYGRPEQPERSGDQNRFAAPSPPPKKHKPAPPPPMNFADLLKIAEKKQFEPIVIEKKEKEEEKLLTKKQRKEMEREKEYLQRKEARQQMESKGQSAPAPSSSNRIPKLGEKPSKHERSDKIYKSGEQRPQNSDVRSLKINGVSHSSSKSTSSHPSAKPNSTIPKEAVRKSSISSLPDRSTVPEKSRTSSSIPSKLTKSTLPSSNAKLSVRDQENYKNANNSLKDRPKIVPTKDSAPKKAQPEESQTRRYLPGDLRYKPPPETKKEAPSNDLKAKNKQIPPRDMKPKQYPPADLKSKQFPPNDLKPKQFPPKDLKPKQFPPPDVQRLKKKPVMVKKGRILDDDSEYDSEMDDFIDDGDAEEDYSKYISEIFGYDKSRYRDVDEDVDNMESTFAQQMKEEVISTKIGIMEDLEDMKKEEEEKKRKAMLKKRKN